MIRHWLVLLVALVGLTTSASAERGHGGSVQQQRACRSDVLRHCRNMRDQDDAAMVSCLKAHEGQLSAACRGALK